MSREELDIIISELERYLEELEEAAKDSNESQPSPEQFFLTGGIQLLRLAYAVRADGEPFLDDDDYYDGHDDNNSN